MNTTIETHAVHEMPGSIFSGIGSGLITEGVGAVATIVLAILALVGIIPHILAPVATIVIGAVILTDGLAAGAAGRRITAANGTARQVLQLRGGVTAGFFGGLAGIVLGILAFFKATPDILLAVAVLVFGAALLLNGGAISHLNRLLQSQTSETPSMAAAGSGGMFVGLAAVVLGILAIVGLVPQTLVLVGLLALGAGALFSGSAMSSEMVQ